MIENKVANSGLKTIDLDEIKPQWTIAGIDIADHLVEGLMLREKDFREFVKLHDWNQYSTQCVYIHCSTDAIVPTWAYMLIANKLSGVAAAVFFGDKDQLLNQLWLSLVADLDIDQFRDQRVIVKGCSDDHISESVYINLTMKLTPVVKSLMFGEPCSTVPIYKR